MPPPRLAAITRAGIGDLPERPTHSHGVPEPHLAGAAALLAAAPGDLAGGEGRSADRIAARRPTTLTTCLKRRSRSRTFSRCDASSSVTQMILFGASSEPFPSPSLSAVRVGRQIVQRTTTASTAASSRRRTRMVVVSNDESRADAYAALAEGRWVEARAAFEQALAGGETAEACFGLAVALWWLGENQACVDRCSRAYALFRRSGDVGERSAVRGVAGDHLQGELRQLRGRQRLDRAGRAAAGAARAGAAARLGVGRPRLPDGRPGRRRGSHGAGRRGGRGRPGTSTSSWSRCRSSGWSGSARATPPPASR